MEREAGKPWGTTELAKAVGMDASRIRQLLIAGDLQGYKVGQTWLIPDEKAREFISEKRARWEKF